jgi:hypothetical protein
MALDTQDNGAGVTQHIDTDETLLTPAQRRFYASEQCTAAHMALQQMVDNPQYNTDSSYFSGNELSFIDRHLYYLSTHPATLVEGYISNLKLMTRIR